MMRKVTVFPCVLIAFVSIASSSAWAQVKYTVTDLGSLGYGSVAYSVNNAGQVVGTARIATTGSFGLHYEHAFLYSGGQMQDLGTLPGPIWEPTPISAAFGINDAGQIAGCASDQQGPVIAFLYDGGQMQQFAWGSAQAINNAGQVVGSFINDSGYMHAFLYSGGQVQDLGPLSGNGTVDSQANGINDSGQVVGWLGGGQNKQAFLYNSGEAMRDIGTLGGTYSVANGIDNAGQVIGSSTTASGSSHAFIYSGGKMNDMGTLGGDQSWANGINNAGQVVGYSNYASGVNTGHAFLYSNGAMTDLNTVIDPSSGWTLYEANAINDVGQIVGVGTNAAGQSDAFLLSLLGDFNHDGVVNAADIDQLYANFTAKTGTYSSLYDVNGDGVVNQADVDYILQNVLHCTYGDANLDGAADFTDFQTLLNHWQQSGAGTGWASGDWNGDGVVDFMDFQMLLNYWNPAGENYAPSQAPEPASLTLILLGALGLVRGRRIKSC